VTTLISSVEDGEIDRDFFHLDWEGTSPVLTCSDVRAEVERFRGQILSKAYALEHQLEALLTWHLFRLRMDDSSNFFAAHILGDGSFGLHLKVKLACRIYEIWEEGDEAAATVSRLRAAKAWRDRVAHWPTRLRPIHRPGGDCIGYEPRFVKGDHEFMLSPLAKEDAIKMLVDAEADAKGICHRIFEFSRDFTED